jgi:hypothetical protein
MSLSAVASAQWQTPAQEQPATLTVRAGIVFPLDDPLRNVSRTFFGLGADYTIPALRLIPRGETYVSFDWLIRNQRGDRGNIFPIMLNQRFHVQPTDPAQAHRVYGFVGLGAVILDVQPAATRFGGRFGMGIEFNDNLVGEVAVVLSDRTRDTNIRANSIGLYLGYRF